MVAVHQIDDQVVAARTWNVDCERVTVIGRRIGELSTVLVEGLDGVAGGEAGWDLDLERVGHGHDR